MSLQHQGAQRTFNVFFPKGYDTTHKYPMWVHMHGVYWADMGDISKQAGYTVPSSDATPVWDTLATGQFREKAIIIYPQATSPGGDLYKRTFWSLPFWRCSVGNCIDENVDDVGYIEKIFAMLPQKFAMDKKKVFLSGTSAGGMMLQNLLCSSSFVAKQVTAAVDIIGGIGRPMKEKCHPARKVPLRIIHGESDQVLRWDQPTDVDGAPFLSTKEAGIMWKELYGCSKQPDSQVWSDATTTCSSLCGSRGRKGGLLEICGMRGVGHDLNNPFQGYPFGPAWDFLSSH